MAIFKSNTGDAPSLLEAIAPEQPGSSEKIGLEDVGLNLSDILNYVSVADDDLVNNASSNDVLAELDDNKDSDHANDHTADIATPPLQNPLDQNDQGGGENFGG